MRILFLSQYFPPEMGAPSARTYELAKYWVRSGHQVTVITGFPNHPTGILLESYRRKLFKREKVNDIDVIRTWIYATPNKGFKKRIINYLSFLFSSLILGTIPARKCDVVIATSPQFFTAVAGYVMSLIKRKPFIFELRDLWPQSIVELGMLKNKTIISILSRMELFLYHRAQKIIGVAESTRNILIERGIEPGKIEIIPNGIDSEIFENHAMTADRIREQYHLNGKFVVSYIGTHGLSHALDSVLECARLLLGNKQVIFLFIGEGAEKENLMIEKNRLGLENVIFMDQQPKTNIAGFYKASDVCLVPLKDLEIFKKVLPSKIFEIMGCGKPIVGALRGEAEEIIEKSGCGVVVEPESPQQLARIICRLTKEPQQLKQMGMNGRRFVTTYFRRSSLANKYLDIIKEAMKSKY